MAVLVLDDRSARIEVTVFSDLFEASRDHLVKDMIVVVEGEVRADDFSGGYKLSAKSVKSLAQARVHFAKELRIRLDDKAFTPDFDQQFSAVLAPLSQDGCQVTIEYQRPEAKACIALGGQWQVTPSDELLQRLRA